MWINITAMYTYMEYIGSGDFFFIHHRCYTLCLYTTRIRSRSISNVYNVTKWNVLRTAQRVKFLYKARLRRCSAPVHEPPAQLLVAKSHVQITLNAGTDSIPHPTSQTLTVGYWTCVYALYVSYTCILTICLYAGKLKWDSQSCMHASSVRFWIHTYTNTIHTLCGCGTHKDSMLEICSWITDYTYTLCVSHDDFCLY